MPSNHTERNFDYAKFAKEQNELRGALKRYVAEQDCESKPSNNALKQAGDDND